MNNLSLNVYNNLVIHSYTMIPNKILVLYMCVCVCVVEKAFEYNKKSDGPALYLYFKVMTPASLVDTFSLKKRKKMEEFRERHARFILGLMFVTFSHP